jgi:hypothetical protein
MLLTLMNSFDDVNEVVIFGNLKKIFNYFYISLIITT